ncbi:unnamed protein product [Gongylonema pulchrum]|uniref:Mediator of RNA polymerase II transcription subunit 24 n=1 Tax=Gongylonema pulchrum TaxID=637853 RepID=A0A183E7I8_9BILA|nr:unnamed protein product [Gongylonema pulchrum]
MNAISPCEVNTYFSHPERMFPEIENDKVPTEQFLRACQGIADFVGSCSASHQTQQLLREMCNIFYRSNDPNLSKTNKLGSLLHVTTVNK